jgi:hypothetical protein
VADRGTDRHKVQAIPYRPESDEERAWLLRHAAAARRTITDVLRQAVAEYRSTREKE